MDEACPKSCFHSLPPDDIFERLPRPHQRLGRSGEGQKMPYHSLRRFGQVRSHFGIVPMCQRIMKEDPSISDSLSIRCILDAEIPVIIGCLPWRTAYLRRTMASIYTNTPLPAARVTAVTVTAEEFQYRVRSTQLQYSKSPQTQDGKPGNGRAHCSQTCPTSSPGAG